MFPYPRKRKPRKADPNEENPRGPTQVTHAERAAMYADRMSGMSYRAIAAKHFRCYETVSKVMKNLDRNSRVSRVHEAYREEMKGKAIQAVNSGLDARKDPYKRGGLGVQVLRGLGEFEGEKQAPGVQVNLQIPPKWVQFFEDRAEPAPERTIEATTISGLEAENDPKTDTL